MVDGTPSRLDGLARWIVVNGPREPLDILFPAFCREIVARGLPVFRTSLGLEVLHPEVSGWQHIWTDGETRVREFDRAGAVTSPDYLDSPTRIVDETEGTFRRRLVGPQEMPLLESLRLDGGTDYVMFPLPFLDRTRTAVAAFATRRTGGFRVDDIDHLSFCAGLLSPYAERQVLRRIAGDLLDTYVGPRTGGRIFEGRIARGQAETIAAAIWYADLRGFTRLSEAAPIGEVIGTLDDWFGAMATVIDAHGGEILKFIGDAVLAIFPIGPECGRRDACRAALAAAGAFCRDADALDARRRGANLAPLGFGLALHLGEVAYGNVGAPRRLDFTVIGPAVNRASRLQGLAKDLGLRLVLSQDFAAEVDAELRDVGLHRLRDIPEPQRVYTLP